MLPHPAVRELIKFSSGVWTFLVATIKRAVCLIVGSLGITCTNPLLPGNTWQSWLLDTILGNFATAVSEVGPHGGSFRLTNNGQAIDSVRRSFLYV
jgi:hypothetical protein